MVAVDLEKSLVGEEVVLELEVLGTPPLYRLVTTRHLDFTYVLGIPRAEVT